MRPTAKYPRSFVRTPKNFRSYRLRLERWIGKAQTLSDLARGWEAERKIRDDLKLSDSETYEALTLIAARRRKLLRERNEKSD